MTTQLLVLALLFCSALAVTQDTYLVDTWSQVNSTNVLVFNNDGSVTGYVNSLRLDGDYSVDMSKNPYWIDFKLNIGYNLSGIYAHTNGSGGRKGLELAIPTNVTEIGLGLATRPTNFSKAVNFVGSMSTTTSSTTKGTSTTGKSTTTTGMSTSTTGKSTTTTGKSTSTTGKSTTTTGKSTSTTGCAATVSCSDCKDGCTQTCKTLAKENQSDCNTKCQKKLCIACDSSDPCPTMSCSDCKNACKKPCKNGGDKKSDCTDECKKVQCSTYC